MNKGKNKQKKKSTKKNIHLSNEERDLLIDSLSINFEKLMEMASSQLLNEDLQKSMVEDSLRYIELIEKLKKVK